MTSKKEAVILAARELFSNYGYRKVSMDEIAQQAGVTKKTIYTYFKDKDALIKFFLNEELVKMKIITDEIDKKDMPFADKIHETLMRLIEHRKNSKLLQAFTKDSRQKSLKVADECSAILNEAIQGEIRQKLELAIAKGHVKPCDPEITSFIIYKVYIALMFEWPKPIDKQKASANIMNILKTGLFN